MPMTRTIRVLAVDDHPLLRAGIASVINAEPGMEIVAEAADAHEAIAAYRQHRPDITLMDLRLSKGTGIEAISAIRSDAPGARIIVLTTFGGDVLALQAFKAGASGYLLKSMMRADLIDTIRLVHAGHRKIPSEIAATMAEHAGEDSLTIRELDVLHSIATGNSNKIIADDLDLSVHTVKGHVQSILSKLGAGDRTHAVVIALKRGILEQ
ncbi:Putative two-component system response regulator (plasmid) [Acidisarcina polymorpha]|uniref:Two-component system response regulator n=2 Tax=Acidisarcina polymorpha TaxID=2211140 RepID=A0A2Z5GC70_9BACT|nr:response regulator transcription factor [Acidisarcina polymorpha]AXC16397.1 Putative two-component system response regulator [Acidisarcina polymorpha]